MASIANITVFDGASTPVSHTLVPTSVTREGKKVIAEWREQIATLPASAQVSCTMTAEVLKSGVTRVDVKTQVPVMESISGQNAAGYTAAPKVAYVDTMVTTGFFHERSTVISRRLARMIHANLLNAVSTSVTAAQTGAVPDLVDSLVSPT